MKRIKSVVFLIMVLLPTILCAQKWIKPAVWHYDFYWGGQKGFYKYMYIGDTIINGKECQHIQSSEYNFFIQPNGAYLGGGPSGFQSYFTYNNGDTVFYLHDSTFKVLYNFGAVTGDSWLYSDDTTGGCDTTYFVVKGHGTVQVCYFTRRYIDIESSANSKYYFNGRAIEGIGMAGNNPNNTYAYNSMLFPRGNCCDTTMYVDYYFYNFKCFEDSITPLYNPSGIDCEYLLNHVGISQTIEPVNQLNIYPNPAKDHIIFDFGNMKPEDCSIELYNVNGQQIQNPTLDIGNSKLDISKLATGLHFIKVVSDGKISYSKFIKK